MLRRHPLVFSFHGRGKKLARGVESFSPGTVFVGRRGTRETRPANTDGFLANREIVPKQLCLPTELK